jgi:prevent-host-death family protein
MKRASISEAKNALSALLDRVRHGMTVTIEDRGVPIARLEPIQHELDAPGRVARLRRQGVVRPPRRAMPHGWLKQRPPQVLAGRNLSDIVIAERGEDR